MQSRCKTLLQLEPIVFSEKKVENVWFILFDNLLKKSYMAILVLISSIYAQTSSTRKKSRFTQRNAVSCIISYKTKYMRSLKRKTDTIRYDIFIFNIMYSLEIPLSIRNTIYIVQIERLKIVQTMTPLSTLPMMRLGLCVCYTYEEGNNLLKYLQNHEIVKIEFQLG